MITEISTTEKETPDQPKRNRETERGGNVTKGRHIRWRLEYPHFVEPLHAEPYDLTQHASGLRKGSRVFVLGRPQTKGELQRSTTTAVRVYAESHYPTVLAGNGASIAYAAAWFGELPYSVRDAVEVWGWLELRLVEAFGSGSALLMTPATTGRDLWARTISDSWPVMSRAAQDAVRPTGGQGRMETLPARGRRVVELYEYDARMAYVALMRELPVGEPELVSSKGAAAFLEAHPYGEGRFAVSWRAPEGWQHPGILPAYDELPGRWCWPMTGSGWCSGAELFTARRAGWRVEVAQAYVWPERAKVLEGWRDRLLRILALGEQLPGYQPAMVRNAVRAMLLHALGAFHGAPHKVSHTGRADQIPADARMVQLDWNGRASWVTSEAARWPQMIHPEWSLAVWGRARARLVSGHRGRTGFLTTDPANLVAFRTDAVYTLAPTGWDEHDDGTPGRYRVRRYNFERPAPWPSNGPELLHLRDKGAR